MAQRVVAAAATAAVAQGTAVVVCHPFRLLGVRLIGQLVGGPQPYTPFGLLNIFETEGIPGLYRWDTARLMPQRVSVCCELW